jgi:hypothetical protein
VLFSKEDSEKYAIRKQRIIKNTPNINPSKLNPDLKPMKK